MKKMTNFIKLLSVYLAFYTAYSFSSAAPEASDSSPDVPSANIFALYNNPNSGVLADQPDVLCPTSKKDPVDPKYRRLAYVALKDLGFRHAHLILVYREMKTDNASVGFMKICNPGNDDGVGISIDEDYYKKKDYGVKRATIYHEAAHFVKKHHTKFRANKYSRECEREADIVGTTAANCKDCTKEVVKHYLGRARKSISLSSCSTDILDHELAKAKEESEREDETHPTDYERALYLHNICRTQKKDPRAICDYHRELRIEVAELEREEAANKAKRKEEEARIKAAEEAKRKADDKRLLMQAVDLAEREVASLKTLEVKYETEYAECKKQMPDLQREGKQRDREMQERFAALDAQERRLDLELQKLRSQKNKAILHYSRKKAELDAWLRNNEIQKSQ